MFRRNPTRIELKVEDLPEYEEMKKEAEEKKNAGLIKEQEIPETSGSQSYKSKQPTINERIGYKPQPRISN